MPEINPLTNEQIFLKKIAENTGSNYETGDVSEINPLTIDQIFLKEIAANTAGQSGDITELEGKVADNTAAIEAIVNVNGCCNILPNNASTSTVHGATLTVNADKTVTIERATPDGSWVMFKLSENVLIKAGTYTLTSLYNGSEKDDVYLVLTDMSDVTLAKTEGVESVEYTFASDTAVRFYITIKPDAAISTPITFKPMLYDARLNPTGYVPYAMTNRELTERVNVIHVEITSATDLNDCTDINTQYEIFGAQSPLNSPNSLYYNDIIWNRRFMSNGSGILQFFACRNGGNLCYRFYWPGAGWGAWKEISAT